MSTRKSTSRPFRSASSAKSNADSALVFLGRRPGAIMSNNRKDPLEMSLKLAHAHATLDLLATVARSKDSETDVESLCVGTLHDTLDGVMREIGAVCEYLDELPARSSEDPAPVATAREANSGYSDDDGKALLKNLSALSNWMWDHSAGQVAEAVGKMTPEHKTLFVTYRQIVEFYLDHAMEVNLESLPAEDTI